MLLESDSLEHIDLTVITGVDVDAGAIAHATHNYSDPRIVAWRKNQ